MAGLTPWCKKGKPEGGGGGLWRTIVKSMRFEPPKNTLVWGDTGRRITRVNATGEAFWFNGLGFPTKFWYLLKGETSRNQSTTVHSAPKSGRGESSAHGDRLRLHVFEVCHSLY